MKILTVVGARPQFVKAVSVSKALKRYRRVKEKILHTGQHYDPEMSKIFFHDLRIPKPYKNLNIGSGSHATQTGRMLSGIEKECNREKPDCLLIYGDTNSTLAGALAASKLLIPVAHVEAGLRSFNKDMPEEQNRITADHLSSLLFAPTRAAVENLKAEGIKKGVYRVGDVMLDTAKLAKLTGKTDVILDTPYFVLTLHRQENTDNAYRLRQIFKGLSKSPFPIIFPAHPRTKAALRRCRVNVPSIVHQMTPIGYMEMNALVRNALAVWTDSGGLQKEAIIMKRPCYTLRPETEWVETLESGWNKLVDADHEAITRIFRSKHWKRRRPPFSVGRHYGNGKASEKIAAHLANL